MMPCPADAMMAHARRVSAQSKQARCLVAVERNRADLACLYGSRRDAFIAGKGNRA
jgi:hypothetical protein